MKLLFVCLMATASLGAAELKDVKSVYLYPMVGGLDQHLANRLTKDHIFRVVADPKLADAVFTDQLGRQFEYRIEHIKREPEKAVAPPPPPPSAPAQPSSSQNLGAAASSGTAGTVEGEPHDSAFSRGKGTIFLVDAKSKQVVWSDFHKPKSNSPHELERTAKQLAMNITKTLTPVPLKAK